MAQASWRPPLGHRPRSDREGFLLTYTKNSFYVLKIYCVSSTLHTPATQQVHSSPFYRWTKQLAKGVRADLASEPKWTSSQVYASHRCSPAAGPPPLTCSSILSASFKSPLKPLPCDPARGLLGIYPREMQTYVRTITCTGMFTAALLTTAKTTKQPRRPSRGAWLNTLWYRRPMEYYLLLNRNELLTAAWMTPQRIMSTETTQSHTLTMA